MAKEPKRKAIRSGFGIRPREGTEIGEVGGGGGDDGSRLPSSVLPSQPSGQKGKGEDMNTIP